MHYGDYLGCGYYASDIFDSNKEIWWFCDDLNITEISDLPEGVYIRNIHKKKVMSGSRKYCLWFIS